MERLFHNPVKLGTSGLVLGGLALASVGGVATIAVLQSRAAMSHERSIDDRSVLSMLAERSPGGRLIGALLMTKQKPQTVAGQPAGTPKGDEPTAQRVIPRRPELETPPAGGAVEPPAVILPGTPDGEAFLPDPDPIDVLDPAGPLVDGPPPPLPSIPSIGGPGVVPPDIFIPPVPPTTNPPPEVPGAIPEPETWAMMVLGLLGCGAMMRRQRRKVRPVLTA